jgi:hypothetical protein
MPSPGAPSRLPAGGCPLLPAGDHPLVAVPAGHGLDADVGTGLPEAGGSAGLAEGEACQRFVGPGHERRDQPGLLLASAEEQQEHQAESGETRTVESRVHPGEPPSAGRATSPGRIIGVLLRRTDQVSRAAHRPSAAHGPTRRSGSMLPRRHVYVKMHAI